MKVLFHSDLKLALEPISAENLALSKQDSELHRILKKSSLYIIAKRPIILFSDVKVGKDNLTFKIVQPYTNSELLCEVPIYQKEIIDDKETEFIIQLSSDFDMFPVKKELLATNIESIFFVKKSNPNKVIKWFSPDAILELYWSEKIQGKIEGNTAPFSSFETKYVGEAVVQNIWERLSKHENFQKILTLETSFTPNTKLSKEIFIMFFRIKNTSDMRVINGMSSEEISNYISQKNTPGNVTIFYDAEKALINVLNPDFNRRIYKSYPKSVNGLINENYQNWSFSIKDPIKLIYKDGIIQGRKDIILVNSENKPIILKNK